MYLIVRSSEIQPDGLPIICFVLESWHITQPRSIGNNVSIMYNHFGHKKLGEGIFSMCVSFI